MPFIANALTVMIASPGDVSEARDAIEQALYGWNNAHARNRQIVLMPWRWETSSVPQLGDHPQSLINAQGVDQCDILFGLFGSRLGSPTPEAVSGTVEEIDRAQVLGKPIHLSFSTEPIPRDVDTKQLEGLRQLRTELQERGLFGEFSNVSQLQFEVWKAIEYDLSAMALAAPSLVPSTVVDDVTFEVQPREERELKGYSSSGKPQYTTRRWLEVTNVGGADAKNVTFEPATEDSRMHLNARGEATIIHSKQTRTVPFMFTMGGEPGVVRIRWTEGDDDKYKEFHVD